MCYIAILYISFVIFTLLRRFNSNPIWRNMQVRLANYKLYFESCDRICRGVPRYAWQRAERRGIANRPTDWRSAADSARAADTEIGGKSSS